MVLKIGAGFLAAFLAVLSAAVLFLIQGGFATVHVEDEELSLYLPVPMAAVELALFLIPGEEMREIREELAPVRELGYAALAELAKCPDVAFVEIDSRDEHVLVRKEGGDLIVDVQGRRGEQVRIRVPLHSAGRIFAALAGKAGSGSDT